MNIKKISYKGNCIYCGEPLKSNWEDYNEYYSCNCEDTFKFKSIRYDIEKLKNKHNEEIRQLEDTLPKPKYEKKSND